MSVKRLCMEQSQPIAMSRTNRRRGMPDVLEGITQDQMLGLHLAYRQNTPPSHSPLLGDVSDEEIFTETIENLSRFHQRRNAVVYTDSTEQLVRTIVQNARNDAVDTSHHNGHVQHH